MRNEFELVEKRELRDGFIDRMEVLDKVGELLLLPDSEFATTEQVSIYYGVEKSTIRQILTRNNEEFKNDGLKIMSGNEIRQELENRDKLSQVSVTNGVGGFIIEGIKFAYSSNTLLPKRAILRIGMMLRDSDVAKEIRTMLLNVYHDAEQGKTEIIENIVEEINEEKQLMMERIDAEMSGDFDKVCVVNAKLFALKNKRIAELEVQNELISTSKLTITESKSVINRIVRKIAWARYRGDYKAAYGELYSSANYKLHTNIKNRKGSGLDRFTEEEIFELEIMARNWAVRVGLDLDELLSLA